MGLDIPTKGRERTKEGSYSPPTKTTKQQNNKTTKQQNNKTTS
jgi:hypothetical protein